MTSLPLGPATRNLFDAPLGDDVRQQFASDPYRNVYTTPTGGLTFSEPSGGFLPSLRSRLTTSARISDELQLGGIGQFALRSGADWYADYQADRALEKVQMPGPYLNRDENGWNVLIGGEQKSARDVGIQELWDSFSTLRQRMMLQAGYSPETLRGIRIQNAEQFAEKWPLLNEAILGRQWLERSAEEAPIRNFFAGATELAAQIGTDPFLLLSLGATSVVKSSAKTATIRAAATASVDDAAKAIEKITGKNYATQIAEYVAEGPSQIAARQAISQGRSGAARAIFQGGATAYGATAGSAMAYAAHSYNLETGMVDPSQDMDVPWLQASMGGLLGFGLSEVGLRAMNRSYGQITKRTYLEESPVYNLGSEINARLYDSKPQTLDQMVDMEHIKAADAIEDYVGTMYTPQQVRELKQVSNLIEAAGIEDSATTRTLRDYLLTMPSHDELTRFLSVAEGDTVSPLQRALDSGDLPETAFAQARRELWELEPKLREARASGNQTAAKALSRQVAAAQNAYTESLSRLKLNDVGLEGKPVGLVDALRSIANDVPISALPTRDLQVAAVQRILNEPVVTENYWTTSIVPWFQNSWLGKTTGYLSPSMRMKRGLGSDNAKEALISRMMAVIDPRGFGQHEILRTEDGRAINNAKEKVRDWEITALEPLNQMVNASTAGKSDTVVAEDFGNIIRASAGLEDALPHNANIVNHIRGRLDDMGSRGVQTTTLNNQLEDFVPIYTVDRLSPDMIETMKTSWFEKHMATHSKEMGRTAPVHYNTLARLGYLKKDGAIHRFASDIPEGFSNRIDPDTGEMLMPQTVADLGDEFVDDYYKALDDSLRIEAEWVIDRRTRKGIDYNPDADDQLNTPWVGETQNAKAINNFVRSEMSRRIEQEVLLDPRVIQSGAIDTNPMHYMEWYGRSTGYNIMRDEALGEMFGQPVRWSVFMDALSREAGDDKAAQEVLKVLEHIDKSNAHRLGTRQEGALPANILANAAGIMASAGVTPTIMGTEGSVTLARALTSVQYYPTLVDNIQTALKHFLDTGYARSIGFENQWDQFSSRVIADHGDHMSRALQDNPAAQIATNASKWTRVVSGERPLTNTLKQMNYDVTYGKLWRYRKNLDKLADMDLQKVVEDSKVDRGLARQAGIPYGDYRLFKQYGLLDPQILRAAQRVHELDSKALSSRGRLRSVMLKLDDPEQAAVRELDKRLDRFAWNDAEDLIATPSAATRASATGAFGDSPWLRLLSGFTSWAMAFQTATIGRAGSASYSKQAGFVALYLAGEIFSQMYRDTVYGGYSIDEAADRWRDKPEQSVALTLSRLPVWGAFNPWMGAVQAMSGGYGTGAASAFDAPALSVFDRAVRSTASVGKSVINGEEISESDIRSMNRIAPPFNLWWLRATERIGEGFESQR